MEIDLSILGDYLPNPFTGAFSETQEERFQLWVDMAVRAEELGFSAVWLGEHHFMDYIISSPQMVLAAIAGRTRKIRLGTAVSLLPNRDPILLAEEFATLDLLSHGRAEVGFGGGITPSTFEAFGQRVEDSAELSKENLDLLERLWDEPRVTWEGKFRAPLKDVGLQPRTRSGRAIPISRGLVSSESTARDAGLRGHKLMLGTAFANFHTFRPLVEIYRESYRKAGHDPSGMSVAASVWVYTETDGRKARDNWARYIDRYSEIGRSRRFGSVIQSLVDARKKFDQTGEAREGEMFGTPAEVIAAMRKADKDAGGLDRMQCKFDAGGIAGPEVFASLELFAREVMPQVTRKLEPQS